MYSTPDKIHQYKFSYFNPITNKTATYIKNLTDSEYSKHVKESIGIGLVSVDEFGISGE